MQGFGWRNTSTRLRLILASAASTDEPTTTAIAKHIARLSVDRTSGGAIATTLLA